MICKLLILLVVFVIHIAVTSSHILAQQEKETLSPVVVTGTTIPTNLLSFPSDITVIDKKIIESSHAESISELLRVVPGIFVDQRGGRGGFSSVYIRGADPNFTLVLLDGVKLNDPNNSRGGSFDLSTISTDNIERIEIIKGPQSAVYGSDALAGVINIITYKGLTEDKRVIDVSAATKNGYRVLTEARGSKNNFYYSFSSSFLNDGEPVEGSKFESPSIITNVGYQDDNLEISSVTRYSHIKSESFPDDSGGPEFAVIRETEKRKANQFISGINGYYYITPHWSNNLTVNFTLIQEDVSSPGVAPGERDPFGIPRNDSDNKYFRLEAKYLNIINILETNAFSFGLDIQYENGKNNGVIFLNTPLETTFIESRYTFSPLAELKLNPIKNFYLNLGGRVDIPQDLNTEFSPHIGVKYQIEDFGTTVTASWGEGFKLPSFFALGNPIVGNPGLKPETSNSYEIKIEKIFFDDLLAGSFTYFNNEFKNLIDLDEGPPPTLVNRSRVKTKGFEAGFQMGSIYNANLAGNISYINSDISGTDEELRNRPEWLANLVLIWMPVRTFEFFVNVNYVGSVLDSSIPTGEQVIGDYVVVDTAITAYFRKNIEAYLAVDNLFNKKYQQFIGFEAPGIRPRIGIR
ncbi:MAG: TonB-dependent receptor plug domain-containing protein, partial [Thermodesulfobacteriota bacterium]